MNSKGKGAKETEGNYASAWINHGLAPKNTNYQYVIYPFNNEAEINNFDKKVKNEKSYTILRADGVVHIVKDFKTNTTGYVVFEANQSLGSGILKEVSEPALVMVSQKSSNVLTISAVQPDLNFPEYKQGKFRNYSTPVQLTITLEGKWSAFPVDFITNIDNSGNNTKVTLYCEDGLPREFIMNKL